MSGNAEVKWGDFLYASVILRSIFFFHPPSYRLKIFLLPSGNLTLFSAKSLSISPFGLPVSGSCLSSPFSLIQYYRKVLTYLHHSSTGNILVTWKHRVPLWFILYE